MMKVLSANCTRPSMIIPPRLPDLFTPPPVEATTGKNNDDEDNEMARIKLVITDPPTETTTSRPPSRTAAARPASRNSSLSKNQKTKNSSNKNKDHTSIAGSIVKLIDSLATNTDEGGDANVAKRMNILMMRQLDSMDRRMERREKEDHKEN